MLIINIIIIWVLTAHTRENKHKQNAPTKSCAMCDFSYVSIAVDVGDQNTHLTNHNYFVPGKNMNTPNCSPMPWRLL